MMFSATSSPLSSQDSGMWVTVTRKAPPHRNQNGFSLRCSRQLRRQLAAKARDSSTLQRLQVHCLRASNSVAG
jgi:hypothetical protein